MRALKKYKTKAIPKSMWVDLFHLLKSNSRAREVLSELLLRVSQLKFGVLISPSPPPDFRDVLWDDLALLCLLS